jgi:hypothetical protein
MFVAARFHLLFPTHLHSPFHLQALLTRAWAFLTHSSFAQTFWPSTAATLVSLIVGLPVALALNRTWLSYTSRPERAENERRLKDALHVLAAALNANTERLVLLQDKLRNKLCPFDSGLDVASWEVVKPAVLQQLRDPHLQSHLARHFAELASISRLTTQYLGYVAGAEAALGGIETAREKLAVHLLAEAERLEQDAHELQTRLDEAARTVKSQRRRRIRRAVGDDPRG